jgi:hypothetical protein
MLKTIRDRLQAFWRQLDRIGLDSPANEQRCILTVTVAARVQTDLRIFGIQERWKVLFARSLEDALELVKYQKVSVVLYDGDLCGSWRKAVGAFSHFSNQPLFVLLSPVVDACIWRTVLDCGGYDVVRNPVDRRHLGRMLDSACALAASASPSRCAAAE